MEGIEEVLFGIINYFKRVCGLLFGIPMNFVAVLKCEIKFYLAQ